MNPEWNTPPNGDFARYVERLSARAGQAPGHVGKEGEHGLDVGMSPSPGQQLPSAGTAKRPEGSAPKAAAGVGLPPAALKLLGVMGATAFLVLWSIGIPFFLLVGGFLLAAWVGKNFLKGLSLKPGVAKWQQVLEEAARRQREQQHKQGSK